MYTAIWYIDCCTQLWVGGNWMTEIIMETRGWIWQDLSLPSFSEGVLVTTLLAGLVLFTFHLL